MLKIQPKYIMVSRIVNSPYKAVSCNSNEMCRHVVRKLALVILTAAHQTVNREGCGMFVISFNVMPCSLVQCYTSEDHNLNIHLCDNLKSKFQNTKKTTDNYTYDSNQYSCIKVLLSYCFYGFQSSGMWQSIAGEITLVSSITLLQKLQHSTWCFYVWRKQRSYRLLTQHISKRY